MYGSSFVLVFLMRVLLSSIVFFLYLSMILLFLLFKQMISTDWHVKIQKQQPHDNHSPETSASEFQGKRGQKRMNRPDDDSGD